MSLRDRSRVLELPLDDPAPVAPPARDYQVAGREFLYRVERGLLGDEAGLGKSRQLIEAARGETLVVAPAMVLDGGTWDDETSRWSDDPDAYTQVAYTSIVQRARKGTSATGVPVYGIDKNNIKPIPEINRRWGTIILDEAHYVKGRKTSWAKALRPLCALADRVYLATGTPIPNWAHELFVPLQLLYPDEALPGRRFGSYWRWVEDWFRVQPSRFNPQARVIGDLLACGPRCLERPPWRPCEHYQEFIAENLGDRFLMRLRDDVLTDLPPLTEVAIQCPMVPAQKRAYAQMKKEFLAELGDGQRLIAWNSGAKHVQLDRISTGLEVASGGSVAGSGKLDRLRFELTDRARPTLVFAHYQSTVDACARVATALGARVESIDGRTSRTDRQSRVRAFQSGRLDVLVGSLETLAEGLTLTQADLVIMVEKSFKPSRNQQAIRRVHRLGQNRPVTVLDLVTPHTVDAKKRELLAIKTDRTMRYITAAQMAQLV